MANSMLYFARHAYCCIEGRNAVVLDLFNNEYLSIPVAQLDALSSHIGNWPRQAEADGREQPALSPDAHSLLGQMSACGLLTPDLSKCNPEIPTSKHPRLRPLTPEPDFDYIPKTHFRHLPSFLIAASRAAAALQWCPLLQIVNSVTRNQPQDVDIEQPASLRRLRSLVEAYAGLRPFFPRPYVCLFDSLALAYFLSLHGIRPRLVFGVQTGPFAAHCWLQFRDIVLNDSVERVLAYTPIMRV